jgi:hypothetical protein
MTHWVIEYLGGTKGDFLTRFLNNEKFIQNSLTNKSKVFPIHLTPYEYIAKNQAVPLDIFCKILEEGKKYRFINAHELFFLNKKIYFEELRKRNYSIKKIIFSKKYYKTIYIESFIKNIEFTLQNFIDNTCQEKDISKYSDTMKAEIFDTALKSEKNFDIFNVFNHHKSGNLNKNFIDYEEIFVKFNCSDSDIAELICTNEYQQLVEKTWCKNKIEIFGEVWNLSNYGYRDF